MKKDIFSSTLRRFVLYIIIIVLLFSSIIIFQTAYSIYDRQKITVENVYPMIKNEVISRQTSLYSNYSSTAYNAQAYLYDSIEKLSSISGMMILIFDEDGRVISYAPKNIHLDEQLVYNESGPLFYLPEDSNYKSLFDFKKELIEGRKLYNKIIGESDSIGRSFVFIDEYSTSRTNPDLTKKIAISINNYKDSEKQTLLSNILLLLLPLLIFMIFAISIISIFAKSVSKPLNEFLGLARSVSQGNLKVRIEYSDDKTEIGELSKTFNNMMDKLEMTENQRAEFASNVAHELRTPMTAIGGFIEGILDGTIPKDKNEIYLKRVSDEIKRLTIMVKDLLILSKMDADDAPLQKSRFDINDIIRRSIIRFEDEITNKKIFINASFSDENTFVYANPDDIERVLINLIHNAIKFTNENGNISIKVEPKKSKVYVYIRDNGIGIDQEDLKNIWTRFYKSDKSRGKDRTGTGLGLSIVFSVIKRHNETIDVKSQKGIGTEFVFTLENAEEEENS